MKGLLTGSFDPITLGHIDIIEKAIELCDDLTVCIFINEEKSSLFTQEQRLKLVTKSLHRFPKIKVDYSTGFVSDYCKDNNINLIYRGFRNNADYDYETRMAEYNLANCGIKTILIPSTVEYIKVSSTVVRNTINNDEHWEQYVPVEIVEDIRRYINERD